MKLTVILLIATCLQVSANGHSQNVTLSEKNAPLKKLFTEIGKQTGYTFFCNESLFENTGMVTVKLKDVTLRAALDICLKEHDLTYTIVGNNIVIKEKEKDKVTTPVIITDPEPIPFIDIKGRVVNEMGEPLAGASVKIKGTDIGTTTDANGDFSINTNINVTLVISYVGHSEIEVAVKKQDLGKLTLKLADNTLKDQVIVVGYGQVKFKDITGSVSSVKSKDIVKSTELSLNSALQGRAAGVQVTSSEGDPGASVSITIRGGSSISASNEPLYVINGFPQLGGSNLNINVNDIESIDILKDAAAAAYGSRGANGVILITTKTGKTGKFGISYDGYATIATIAREIPLINISQYAELQHFLRSWDTFGDTSIFKNWRTFKDSASKDWYGSTFRRGVNQSHNLTFTGGTENLKLSGSFGYTRQQGIAINNNYNRYTINLNSIANLNKVVSNQTVIYLTQSDRRGPRLSGSSQVMYSVIKAPPYIGTSRSLADFLTQHSGRGGSYGTDPIEALTVDRVLNDAFDGSINTAFSFKILDNLILRIAAGYSSGNYEGSYFYPANSGNGELLHGQGSIDISKNNSWLSENTLNYKKTFADVHSLDVTVGYTMQSGTSKGYYMSSHNFPIDLLGNDNLGFGTIPDKPSTSKSKYGLESYLGIVRYGYKDKYLASLIMRADGSSKFPNNKWGYFPSAQVAWKINDEPFMAGVHQISTLKLRTSWGMTGNESVPPYSSLSRFTNFSRPVVIDEQYPLALAPLRFGVGDLKWETNIQANIGLDLGLFNDRISLTVDAYRKKSKDLLLAAPIAYFSGYSEVYRNIGDIEVKGMEINLNTINVKARKFTWSSNFNIAFNKGKVLALSENQKSFELGGFNYDGGGWIVKVGERLGGFYGLMYDGIVNTDEELYTGTAEHSIGELRAGSKKYKDISGPDGKPDGIVDDDDRTVLGNGNPKFFGGFNNEFRYGPFELSCLFTFTYGNKIMNGQKNTYELPSSLQGGPVSMFDRWTQSNPNINEQLWNGAYDFEYYYTTSFLMEDGSYLRLKNLLVGYTFPVKRKMPFTRLRLYASAQNVLTFTKYTGSDPEVNFNNSIITPGLDYGAYPRSRMFTFGINASF